MEGESEDAIAAEGCNQAHEQRSRSRAPGKSHPEIDSEGVANGNAVIGEATVKMASFRATATAALFFAFFPPRSQSRKPYHCWGSKTRKAWFDGVF